MGCLPCLDSPKDPSLTFANSERSAAGDSSIPQARRVYFGIFFPEDSPHRPVHMFFDRQKATSKVLDGAAAHAGLKLDKGRIVGSPERLNVFTTENEILRLDLEIDAHMHGTLHPCDQDTNPRHPALQPAACTLNDFTAGPRSSSWRRATA